MKTIKIAKADNLEEKATPVTIIINGEIPKDSYPAFDIDFFYYTQATDLSRALFSSLPQGTLDRLLVALLKRKVSFYRGLTKP